MHTYTTTIEQFAEDSVQVLLALHCDHSRFPQQAPWQTVLDLYSGIGFWTLPLLVAGADRVFSCEWNPDAVEALRRGLALLGEDLSDRCEVCPGSRLMQGMTRGDRGFVDSNVGTAPRKSPLFPLVR